MPQSPSGAFFFGGESAPAQDPGCRGLARWDGVLLPFTSSSRLLGLRGTLGEPDPSRLAQSKIAVRGTNHVSELLGMRLGLVASICQSTTRTQVMTRL